MYKLRWRVELSFKRLKSHLNINKMHAKSERLWKQEMQHRILLDTITRQCQIRSYTGHVTKKVSRNSILYIYTIKTVIFDSYNVINKSNL